MKTKTPDLSEMIHASADGERVELATQSGAAHLATVSPCRATLAADGLRLAVEGASYYAADLADHLRREGIPCRRSGSLVRIPREWIAGLCFA